MRDSSPARGVFFLWGLPARAFDEEKRGGLSWQSPAVGGINHFVAGSSPAWGRMYRPFPERGFPLWLAGPTYFEVTQQAGTTAGQPTMSNSGSGNTMTRIIMGPRRRNGLLVFGRLYGKKNIVPGDKRWRRRDGSRNGASGGSFKTAPSW